MQEEVNQKTVALVINTSKLTGRGLARAMSKFLAHVKYKQANPTMHRGKQTVKQLAQHGQGMSSIEVTDENIKSFEKVARKYGVDFAVMRDKGDPKKHIVFFKGRDSDAINNAFEAYTKQVLRKANRPSILAKLKEMAELVKNTVIDRVKHKEQSR
ncbi:PcfB family protein [Bengtsoniella intestinalis]|uniref:PcfB family protein n=1 Tax=Bengtsoniella intestinalis TaxID=3073143 RepID=UPI00391F5867